MLQKMSGYPQPPPLISRYIDTQLRENAALLGAAKSYESAGSIRDCVSYLEAAHASLLHLGRLADVQTIRHGLPPASTDVRKDCGLGPRDELLQTVAMALTAYHMLPPRQEAATPADRAAEAVAGTQGAGAASAQSAADASAGGARSNAPSSAFAGASAGGPAPVLPATGDRQAGKAEGRASRSSSRGPAGVAASSAGSSAVAAPSATAAAPASSAGDADDGGARWDTAAKSRTRWSVEEIAMFEAGVAKFGLNKPSQIAAFMGTRNAEQVRERIKWWKRKVGILKKWQPGQQGAPGCASAGPVPTGVMGGDGGAGEDGEENDGRMEE